MIPVANATVGEEEARAVSEVVKSGWLSQGRKVEEFENRFKKVVGAKHAIAVNNGTAALHVAPAALGVKQGDEVILPSLTFVSTANAVLYQNAKPMLVECEPKTYNVTADIVESAITKRTKVIVPVDMNGMPSDYDAILEVAEKHDARIVWDSAESLGAKYKQKMVGGIASLQIFSFFPNKNVTTGEGGMITTSDDELNDKIRVLRHQGQDYRYHHIELGFNYRMTELQAAIGIEQLKKLTRTLEGKQRIAEAYDKGLADAKHIQTPSIPDYVTQHAWYAYAISVDRNRDAIVEKLKKKGIDTRMSFPPIHMQPLYQKLYGFTDNSFPVTYDTWTKLIDIPIWPGLDSEQQQYIINTLLELCE